VKKSYAKLLHRLFRPSLTDAVPRTTVGRQFLFRRHTFIGNAVTVKLHLSDRQKDVKDRTDMSVCLLCLSFCLFCLFVA